MTQKHTDLENQQASGSPLQGEPEFLAVGKLHRPHGVRGEVLMSVWTDFPERLAAGALVYLGEKYQPIQIQNTRWHRQQLLVTFDGITDRDQAGTLRNQHVFVKRDQVPPLEADEYYLHQLIGMRVIDEADVLLGTLVEVLETGANDVYIVRPEIGKEILVPAIETVILDLDLVARQVRVRLLPGLLPE
jgi:16S rRNA processing protein RimM